MKSVGACGKTRAEELPKILACEMFGIAKAKASTTFSDDLCHSMVARIQSKIVNTVVPVI